MKAIRAVAVEYPGIYKKDMATSQGMPEATRRCWGKEISPVTTLLAFDNFLHARASRETFLLSRNFVLMCH